MASEETQFQSPADRRRASQLSQQPTQPPTDVPGYEPQRFLGRGAYGEVWVAIDENTRRQVAIKFFAHRSSVDWPMLTREVEKLVVLSADRYIVQLLDVGWNADPPYYVMEYIENGSLADLLESNGLESNGLESNGLESNGLESNGLESNGTLSVQEAVRMFRGITIGLSHAHGKGVLHCDLKPANILLDQDRIPRLADFGQSRLTSDQSPALGTLFYMAPEQADLDAVPDARWDVYALGAVLYRMLTGNPPYRSAEAFSDIDSTPALPDRLQKYRDFIRSQPPAVDHRKVPGIDKKLAKIVEHCLAVDPDQRFPSVQNVLAALGQRDDAKLRRPLYVLGVLGPLLLMMTIAIFGYRAYQRAIAEAESLAIEKSQEASQFAAEGEARNVAHAVDKRFLAITDVCENEDLRKTLTELLRAPNVQQQLNMLADFAADEKTLEATRAEFRRTILREALQHQIDELLQSRRLPPVASWIVTDNRGTMLAAAFYEAPNSSPVGKNYAYRSYFHGGPTDLKPGKSAPPPLSRPHLSAPFSSTATNTYKVAISSPIVAQNDTLGVLAMTFELGHFVQFSQSKDQCAVLIDARHNDHRGMILQHPLYEELRAKHKKLPFDISDPRYRVDVEAWRSQQNSRHVDPLSRHELGKVYAGDWIVRTAPVQLEVFDRDGQLTSAGDTNLLLSVEQRLSATVKPVAQLGRTMYTEATAALLFVALVSAMLWLLVLRMLAKLTA